MLGWVAAAGQWGRDEAVARMATQKWLHSRYVHSEPGKMTGPVREVAGFVSQEEKMTVSLHTMLLAVILMFHACFVCLTLRSFTPKSQ